ncbi:hypothetical protein BLNAU_20227 [Blattamonas nauphoetae]|uniref:Uncharacterized protein n=1 Tax=Blattamonas nauphoetae TaxID=2049346 RepID=A0ABQ9X3E9_9EUKA|nr:hypothetical protein BLNAU_20227 [Blattamonas nauphoetae]
MEQSGIQPSLAPHTSAPDYVAIVADQWEHDNTQCAINELVRLEVNLVDHDPNDEGRDKQLDVDQAQYDQILGSLKQQKVPLRVIRSEIAKRLKEILAELKEKLKRKQQSEANNTIVDSQSYTITLTKSILRDFSPHFKDHLKKPINTFRFLQDGHIFFSKNWLKNHRSAILSTPLLFRPIYNVILHRLLNYILKHFADAQNPSKGHPGAVFFITGDQGIGKTSLMLLLMSALSELSINFLYREGSGRDFHTVYHTVDKYGKVEFIQKVEMKPNTPCFIHILDDCLPVYCIEPNHLYIIFTSPDKDRLAIGANSRLIRCFFRLPTFSLAEDAVAMVGCTPTVPFALLSPEDMELHAEEQKTLISIEREKGRRARQLPFESEALTLTSEQQSAKDFLKAMANSTVRMTSNWTEFMANLVARLYSNANLTPEQCDALDQFLIGVTVEHDWNAIVALLITGITPTLSQMEDTTDSIVTHFRMCVGHQATIDSFFLSLYQTVLDTRSLPNENRFNMILDRWISHLDVHTRPHDKEAPIVKDLLIQLMLSDWNKQETVSETCQEEESDWEELNLEVEKQKTDALFDFVLKHIRPHHDAQPQVDRVAARIQETLMSDQSPTENFVIKQLNELRITSTAQDADDDSLATQLKNLKERFEEPNKPDRETRRILLRKVEEIRVHHHGDNKELRTILLDTLIDILITPPSYDSSQLVLQSLFASTESINHMDHTILRIICSLLTESDEQDSDEAQLLFIVEELVKHLRFTEGTELSSCSNVTYLPSHHRKLAQIACDLLTTIVDPEHKTATDRLETVKEEIRDVRDHLSFMRLMDSFFIIARNMNILVTPHSILKGLSERAEETPDLSLDEERQNVFSINLRDDGLREWIQTATETILDLNDTPETDCVKNNKDSTTKQMQLEERVVDTVISSILGNVNEIINKFNENRVQSEGSVVTSKWLAVVRSMMTSILFLIDAGIHRREILTRCDGLGAMLTTVYETHNSHLQRVADYPMTGDQMKKGVGDDENAADYVNDFTIISQHHYPEHTQSNCGKTSTVFDMPSLNELQLPRTLQMNPASQDRLERMSIALFARNLLWFLEVEEDLPFDGNNYVAQFFNDFLYALNPEDVVHRSFVDFMNATGLLSQQNFGLEHDEFKKRLEDEQAAEESGTRTLQMMWQAHSLRSPTSPQVRSIAYTHPYQPSSPSFQQLQTPLCGVCLLLWASTELLLRAARGSASPQSGDENAISCLNVARTSVFGPSPRWLTSTDVRTNFGLSFLWDGVKKSETTLTLRKVTQSYPFSLMGFDTEHVLFENNFDVAWNDVIAQVPVLSDPTKEKVQPTHMNAIYSMMTKKTALAIEKMKSQISFLPVSLSVDLIIQSEVVSAVVRLEYQSYYEEFRKLQEAKRLFNLPIFLETPLLCVSFLLNFPTPISVSTAASSFQHKLLRKRKCGKLWRYSPVLETTATIVTSIPALTFPNLSNRSVNGTTFPYTLSKTDRGKTDFYCKDLQRMDGSFAGIDSLIVSRGSDEGSETIFMPIQTTFSRTHSLLDHGVVQIQQLLFQTMRHLEPFEGVVALYNCAAKPEDPFSTSQEEAMLPSQTGILGFHMVSSLLKFGDNVLTHMPSILRHRDNPLVTTSTEPQPTMSTHSITEKLLANLPPYPTFSKTFNPWKTTLPTVINPNDPNFILPFRWYHFYFFSLKTSAIGSFHLLEVTKITDDEKKTKDWRDGMIRRTIHELHRIGIGPDDLGETEKERIETFSSFLLSTAISCRRNELIDPNSTSTTGTDDADFVELIQAIVGTDKSETIKTLLPSLSCITSTMTSSIDDERLGVLDSLCGHPSIEARLHTVHRVMTIFALKRSRNPAQLYLSLLQSKKDGGEFRVPARSNLSAILHCGTVLLDHLTTSSSPPSEPPPRSRALRIPLHSYVLAKYGFSDSIPALYEFKQGQLRKEVTNVVPAPLNQWHPCRVVIDPSLLPLHISQAESLSLFTTFIHRLFDNPFIPVTTSLSTDFPHHQHDGTFLLSQIRKIENILTSLNLEEKPAMRALVSKLSAIEQPEQASAVFPLLPTIRLSLRRDPLPRSRYFRQRKPLSSDQMKELLTAIKSIESAAQQPILVFARAGSDFFKPTNRPSEFILDTETESRPFPIPFSTTYKEMELQEEMKQVFKPLTQLLPTRFLEGRPELTPPQNQPKMEQGETSSSKDESENVIGRTTNATILDLAKTWKTPLFVFVVDEDPSSQPTLPMSLLSSEDNIRCGMMRQRSLADILWILFLTRISREVMALPLNTKVDLTDFTSSVIPFFANAFLKTGLVQRESAELIPHKYAELFPSLPDALVPLESTPHLKTSITLSSVGLELLVLSYPKLNAHTHVLPLTHLLLLYPSRQAGESRLDLLIHHPSPEIVLITLARYFELLHSKIQKTTLEDVIKSGFTPTKVGTNLLHAFYLIIEHEHPNASVEQLFKSIKAILDLIKRPFFDTAHEETLQVLKHRVEELIDAHAQDKNRLDTLGIVYAWVISLLGKLDETPATNESLLVMEEDKNAK